MGSFIIDGRRGEMKKVIRATIGENILSNVMQSEVEPLVTVEVSDNCHSSSVEIIDADDGITFSQ